MAEETTEDLIKAYYKRKAALNSATMWGTSVESPGAARENALRTQLAQLKDAQVASRAALIAGDREATADADQAVKIALMRALATYGASANNANAKKDANLRRQEGDLRDVLWGGMSWHAKRDFNTLRDRLVDEGQLDADSELFKGSLRTVLGGDMPDADRGEIISRFAASLRMSEPELREKLESSTTYGNSFKGHFSRIDQARASEGADKREARMRLAAVESELATLPGITYGGVLHSIVGLGDGTIPAGEEDAALERALNAMPKETNLMRETGRQLESARSLVQIIEDAAKNEDFQHNMEVYGFTNPGAFMEFLLNGGVERVERELEREEEKEKRQEERGLRKAEKAVDMTREERMAASPDKRRGREEREEIQEDVALGEELYDTQNIPDLSTVEAVKAYMDSVREQLKAFDAQEKYDSFLKLSRESEAYLQNAWRTPGLDKKVKEALREGGKAARSYADIVMKEGLAVEQDLARPDVDPFGSEYQREPVEGPVVPDVDSPHMGSMNWDRHFRRDPAQDLHTEEEMQERQQRHLQPGPSGERAEFDLLEAQEPSLSEKMGGRSNIRELPELDDSRLVRPQSVDSTLEAAANKAPGVKAAKRKALKALLPKPDWAKVLEENQTLKEGGEIRTDAHTDEGL